MKAQTLALIAITAFAAPISASAQQQQHHDGQRYQVENERSRFPTLRKAFRQIRSDIRYQAGAIRETASYIRHDLEDTIRGERSTQDSYSQYGYRGERQPVDVYPPPQRDDRREYQPREYDPREVEPRFPRHAERSIPAPEVHTEPERRSKFRIRSRRDESPESEPQIVAPRDLERLETAAEKKIEKPKAPARDLKPEPRPEVQPKPEAKAAPKSPDYPLARPSDRSGFHYSPYPPFELLDTQDVEPGGLARDPGTGKIFRLPK